MLWDLEHTHSVKDIAIESSVRCLAWISDTFLVIGALDGKLLWYNAKTDKVLSDQRCANVVIHY